MSSPHESPASGAGSTPVWQSDIPDLPVRRGKVRDVYDFGDRLLMVATDRVSTFDVVHPTAIPDKGRLLTELSLYWFERLSQLSGPTRIEDHILSADPVSTEPRLAPFADQLTGRAVLVRKLRMVPIECVVRGYLAGSGWADYQATGAVCGHRLPSGLRRCERLPEPLFTPAIKSETGHDENITLAQAAAAVGSELMAQLAERSLAVYRFAAQHAQQAGIILADTKLEWGFDEAGRLRLADEVLTPDSSRFWPLDNYTVGREPDSFDKQYVRNYVAGLGWNKTPPAPALPPEVVAATRAKYIEAYQRLTGRAWHSPTRAVGS